MQGCPDHVNVIPPNATMTVVGGILRLEPRGELRGPHLPVDQFFKSLAIDRQEGAIGVILSGSGSDGTLGVEESEAAGGSTFAQGEQPAPYPRMPHRARPKRRVAGPLPPRPPSPEL